MDKTGESGAQTLGITEQNVWTRRYDEGDIATLENGDLTDLMVEVALGIAYEQNDPEAGDPCVILQRSPGESAEGSPDELKQRLVGIERELDERPKRAFLRKQRAATLCSLARREAARGRTGEQEATSAIARGRDHKTQTLYE